MESPKRGCDLGPCVLKRCVQKTHCDHFLRFKDFPRGQGLRLGPLRSKNAAFCVCVLKPTKFEKNWGSERARPWRACVSCTESYHAILSLLVGSLKCEH